MPEARNPAKGAKSDAINPMVSAPAFAGLMLMCTGHIISWFSSTLFFHGTQFTGSNKFPFNFSFIHIRRSNEKTAEI